MQATKMIKFDAEHIYSAAVTLAFGLLFFANADEQVAPDGMTYKLGLGKVFYFPCGIALLCSLFFKRNNDPFNKRLKLLVGIALFASLIHPPLDNDILSWSVTRFVCAIFCFRDIRIIGPKLFSSYITAASPFIIIPHYILSNPFSYGDWRYSGFYGDPNFLALALILIICICFITICFTDSRILKIEGILSIITAIPLILLGASRGGIAGLILILSLIVIKIAKSSKAAFFIILISGCILAPKFINTFGSTFLLIRNRFASEEIIGDRNANDRIDGIVCVLNVLTHKPTLIPFGIGPGNTIAKQGEYEKYGYTSPYGVHNTFFQILYEMGIFAFIIYISLYISPLINLFRQRRYLIIGLAFCGVLSLSTLPGSSFMPGWILLFFINNNRIQEIEQS